MHITCGKHMYYITCEYCNQDIEFTSETEMRRHFKAQTRKITTCVNVLRWREHDPVYNSHNCRYCQERIPGKIPGISEMDHYIADPSNLRHTGTCINVLEKRQIITCHDCKGKFKFADLRKHWPEGTPFDLRDPNYRGVAPSIAPCIKYAKILADMKKGIYHFDSD